MVNTPVNMPTVNHNVPVRLGTPAPGDRFLLLSKKKRDKIPPKIELKRYFTQSAKVLSQWIAKLGFGASQEFP